MSSYELFSVAQDLRRRAAACEQARAKVDAVWRGLDEVLDGPLARHQPEVWMSASADASRLRLRRQHIHLVRLLDEIKQIAWRLQRLAGELYADAETVERAAEAALRAEAGEPERTLV